MCRRMLMAVADMPFWNPPSWSLPYTKVCFSSQSPTSSTKQYNGWGFRLYLQLIAALIYQSQLLFSWSIHTIFLRHDSNVCMSSLSNRSNGHVKIAVSSLQLLQPALAVRSICTAYSICWCGKTLMLPSPKFFLRAWWDESFCWCKELHTNP